MSRTDAILKRLTALYPKFMDLDLGRERRLLDDLGRPQDRLPPVIHVAGTNAKGSTIAYLRAFLEAAGRRVHVYTSPHLVRINERFRVAGKLATDEQLEDAFAQCERANDGAPITLFEIETAAAFVLFSQHIADVLLLEVGLGGRLDATNVIADPVATGIAVLGLDHQAFLGNRIEDIAAEKAGIAKAGVPLVTQIYPAAVANRIGEAAAERGARWFPRGGDWDALAHQGQLHYRDRDGKLDLPLPRLAGAHQATNAAACAAVALAAGLSLAPVAASLGAIERLSPWRMEVVERPDGLVVVNDAYNANPDSMRAALETLARMGARGDRRTVAVLGEMRELGGSAAEEHRAVGVLAHELGIDKVLVVGDGARGVYDALVELRGEDGTTRHVDTVDEAGAWLRENVSGPDAVLVKASRSGRLERVAEELVAERPGEESGR